MQEPVPAITLNSISATYQEGGQRLPVVDNFSLQIAAGECVAIVGPSGSGKSTLLDIIAGLIEPDSGSITLFGGMSQSRNRLGQSGYLRQRDLLMPWRNIESNAAVGLEARGVSRRDARARARTALKQFGLDQFAGSWPSQLSGGMRQRVAVLRTLLLDTPILLLDEPFASLDAITRSEMHLWLQNVLAESPRTTLLVTHDIEEALVLADRIGVISARPASVITEYSVPFARPRRSDLVMHPDFVTARSNLVGILHQEVTS